MQGFSLGPEHWQSEELLPRYATLLKAGQDAAEAYPDVAAHLRRCPVCRDTLADLLANLPPPHALTDPLGPSDIPAIEEAASRFQNTQQKPWSCTLSLPLFAPANSGITRAAPSQSKGKAQLLYYGDIEIHRQKYLAMLTFEQTAATLGRIAGEIAGVDQVPVMAIDLDIPGFISTITSHNGKFVFDNIPILPEAVSALITMRNI